MSYEPFDYDPMNPISHAELMRRAHEMRAQLLRDAIVSGWRWLRARVSALGAASGLGRAA